MADLVLVHGGWHTGDHWANTASELTDLGWTVHTPTVAGTRDGDSPLTSFDDAYRSIVDYIEAHDLRDLVLLGHSYGGTVVTKVAESVADRLQRLVFQNAFICESGNSLYDELPPALQQAFDVSAEQRGDGTVELPFAVWRELFINDADAELAKATYESLRPHPLSTLNEKLDLTRFYELTVPRSFINAREDMTLTQLPEYGWHPRMSHRLGIFRYVEMPGSHEVLLSDPKGLAVAINKASRP